MNISDLLSNLDMATVWTILTSVIALASTIAAVTPSPKDDSVVAWVRKVIDTLALNVANAKNEKK